MGSILTDKQKDEIVEKYLSDNLSYKDIGKIYDRGSLCIYRVLKKKGVKIKESNTKFIRKYTLNEHYFDIIDTEEKAYFLGLIMSDGCNSEKLGVVTISLQEGDKEILEKLNKAIDSNKPLQFQKKQKDSYKNIYTANIHSKITSIRLAELGCVANKSLKVKFPTEEQVSTNLIRHFIRGFYDGNGCCSIHTTNTGAMNVKVCIVSSENFCEGFKTCLLNAINVNSCIGKCSSCIKNDTPVRQLWIGGNGNSKIFLDWIYENSTVYLERKYRKYQEAKEVYIYMQKRKDDRRKIGRLEDIYFESVTG